MDTMTPEQRAALFYDDVATHTGPDGRTLSDRIWRNRQALRQRIDATLRDAIREGRSVEDTATDLERFISPSYAKPGDGVAHYAASRLAYNETKRAHGLATRAVSETDPAGGFMRYRLSRIRHIDPHDCDEYAAHDEGYGRGIWPAATCPIPNVDTHVGCRCVAERVPLAARGMDDVVDQLRAEYGLEDPTDLSPEELAEFRRLTQPIRDQVQFMFRAWFEQTGLVTREQLVDDIPTVAQWVKNVRASRLSGRAGRVTQAVKPRHVRSESDVRDQFMADASVASNPREMGDDVVTAWEDYQGSSYQDFNTYLRGGDLRGAWTVDEIRAALPNLDAGMRRFTLDGDTRVYRGTDFLIGKEPVEWTTLQPGSVITDRAYISTTFERRVAEQFGFGREFGPDTVTYGFNITAPSGANYMPIAGMGEAEMVFPRGSRLIVRKVTTDTGPNGTVVIVDADLIPAEVP